MNIKSILAGAMKAGTTTKKDDAQRIKTHASDWMDALVKDAQDKPEEFVLEGVTIPPWSVFKTTVFAYAHKDEIIEEVNNLLPSGYEATDAGTFIRLKAC